MAPSGYQLPGDHGCSGPSSNGFTSECVTFANKDGLFYTIFPEFTVARAAEVFDLLRLLRRSAPLQLARTDDGQRWNPEQPPWCEKSRFGCRAWVALQAKTLGIKRPLGHRTRTDRIR
jgi:hypothetical protein